jgi:broad specificity phosphatase PhoE
VRAQTEFGRQQAREAGEAIRGHMQALHGGNDFKLYFYTSPYKRGLQTYEGIRCAH